MRDDTRAQSQPCGAPKSAATEAEPAAAVKTLEELQAEIDAAQADVYRVDNHMRDEIEAATAEIKARWADRIAVAATRQTAARAAMTAARDAGPDHPWTGKRVFQMKVGRYSWERLAPTRLEGVVETYRSTTVLPANTASYARPRIGDPIVRLLTKDGKPGLKFERMSGDRHGWKLSDEDTTDRPAMPREDS